MRTGFIPWTEVVLAQLQPYQHVTWFILGNIEREHRLNVEALSTYGLRAYLAWLAPLQCRAGTHSPR
jgi:hypothetical protein